MTLEDAMWHLRAHEEPPDDHRTEEEILALVKTRSDEFDRSIRRRDRREIIAGIIVFAIFSILLVTGSWLTRLGAMVVLAGCVVAYIMLRRAYGQKEATAGQPLVDMLRFEWAKVEAQIHLLRRVLWWYITPFAVGPVLAFVGIAGFSVTSAAYTVLVIALGAAIYYMNQQAVRLSLIPRRNELDHLLRQVED